jgi:hypothetical protein
MNTAWPDERRQRYSEAAKARWAEPFYRANHGKSIQKSPCCPGCGEANIANFMLIKKVVAQTSIVVSAAKNNPFSVGTKNRYWIVRHPGRTSMELL